MSTSASDTFVFYLRKLGRAAGNHEHVERVVILDEPIGLDLIAIPEGNEVTLDLELEAVSEGVLVTGTISADTVGQCVLCLSEIQGSITASLTELFVYPDSETADSIQDDDEVYLLEDPEELDLEQAVIDAVGLALPFAPTCSTVEGRDCPETDTPAPDGVEGEENDIIDPRWVALEQFQLLGDTEEEESAE